jgi:hypothetical protein
MAARARALPTRRIRSGQPVSRCSRMARPPISAAHVITFSRFEAISVTRPSRYPRRVPDDRKHRLAGDDGNPSAHLHIKDDADGAERNRPNELVSKQRARLRREYNLPKVDEAAKCRHDAEGDAEELSHRQAPAARRVFRIVSTRSRVAAILSLTEPPPTDCSSRASKSSCSAHKARRFFSSSAT